MKPIKFFIFGYCVQITKGHPNKLHITNYIKEDIEEIPWEYSYPIEKRVEAMIGHHGFIEYIFRDFSIALISYRESALILLEDIMKSLIKIRSNLALKGASDEDLLKFDTKVHICFQNTLNTIKERIKDKNSHNIEADKHLLITLESFKIYEYYKGE